MPERMKKIWRLSLDRQKNVLPQIEEQVINLLKEGRIAPGEKVPSMRIFAELNGISHSTAEEAYDQLRQKFIFFKKKGRTGSYVHRKLAFQVPGMGGHHKLKLPVAFRKCNESIEYPSSLPGLKTFIHAGDDYPEPHFYPFTKMGKAYDKALLASADIAVNKEYVLENFRNSLMSEFFARGIAVNTEQFATTCGMGEAFRVTIDMLLQPGDAVVLVFPGERAIEAVLEQRGVRIFYAGADEEGISLEGITQIMRNHSVKMVLVNSISLYPTTATLSEERGRQLLELAVLMDFLIIEYSEDSEFRYRKTPRPLAGRNHDGRVIYISSLSKLNPILNRVGLVAGANDFIYEFRQRKYRSASTAGIVHLQALQNLIEGSLTQWSRIVAKRYAEKIDFFKLLLDNYFGNNYSIKLPAAGLAVWFELPGVIDAKPLKEHLREQGMFSFAQQGHYRYYQPIQALWIGLGGHSNHCIETLVKFLAKYLS